MKKLAMIALSLFGAALVLGVASCSNASGGGNNGNGGGVVPAGCVSVPAKSFDGTTAITGSSVFIAGRSLSFKALYASDHEVTQKEYESYCKYGSTAPSDTIGKGDNYPAYYVSWYDAIVYCNLRSKAEGLTPCYKLKIGGVYKNFPDGWTGIVSEGGKYCGPSLENSDWNGIEFDTNANGWRLPTEAEWEMLARGGNLANSNQTTYSGSDTIGDVAWYGGNSDNKIHEVKTKTKNSLNLYDMSGNVREWCWDWYDSTNTPSITSSTPATGASSGSGRVFRGGDWSDDVDVCLVANRNGSSPDNRYADRGFRVVRTAN